MITKTKAMLIGFAAGWLVKEIVDSNGVPLNLKDCLKQFKEAGEPERKKPKQRKKVKHENS